MSHENGSMDHNTAMYTKTTACADVPSFCGCCDEKVVLDGVSQASE